MIKDIEKKSNRQQFLWLICMGLLFGFVLIVGSATSVDATDEITVDATDNVDVHCEIISLSDGDDDDGDDDDGDDDDGDDDDDDDDDDESSERCYFQNSDLSLDNVSILAIYAFAFDNPDENPASLTPYYEETLTGLRDASLLDNKKIVVALFDLNGEGDTVIHLIRGGMDIQVSGLPNTHGELDVAITEYNMTHGDVLGGYLLWARALTRAKLTMFSFVGHGTPLAPAQLSMSQTEAASDDVIPLPSWISAFPGFTDKNSVISAHSLAVALSMATDDGRDPIDVLDLLNCFSMTAEQAYELHFYTETIIGSASYAFFDPLMIGNALENLSYSMSDKTVAKEIVESYNDFLPYNNFPRIITAIDSSDMPGVKHALDALSSALLDGLLNDDAYDKTLNKMLNATNNSNKFDTSFCQQDFMQDSADILTDISELAQHLSSEFGEDNPIADSAERLENAIDNAVLRSHKRNGRPYFANKNDTQWEFVGSGLAIYTDFAVGSTASWQGKWYQSDATASVPHPFKLLQNSETGVSWADVHHFIWDEFDIIFEDESCATSTIPVSTQ